MSFCVTVVCKGEKCWQALLWDCDLSLPRILKCKEATGQKLCHRQCWPQQCLELTFTLLYTPNDNIHKCKKYNTIFKFTVSECDIYRECPANTAQLSAQNHSCWHSYLNVTMGRTVRFGRQTLNAHYSSYSVFRYTPNETLFQIPTPGPSLRETVTLQWSGGWSATADWQPHCA
jgi:hypothetical protein